MCTSFQQLTHEKTTDKPTKTLTAKFDKVNLSAEKTKEAFIKKR